MTIKNNISTENMDSYLVCQLNCSFICNQIDFLILDKQFGLCLLTKTIDIFVYFSSTVSFSVSKYYQIHRTLFVRLMCSNSVEYNAYGKGQLEYSSCIIKSICLVFINNSTQYKKYGKYVFLDLNRDLREFVGISEYSVFRNLRFPFLFIMRSADD